MNLIYKWFHMTGREQNQHLDNLSEAPYILVLGQHLKKEVVSEPNAKRAAWLQVEWNTKGVMFGFCCFTSSLP